MLQLNSILTIRGIKKLFICEASQLLYLAYGSCNEFTDGSGNYLLYAATLKDGGT
jgi:hypothetical protein